MSDSLLDLERWEFGALDIHHPETCTLKEYFSLIPKLEKVPGTIVELGVAMSKRVEQMSTHRRYQVRKIFQIHQSNTWN